MRKRLDDVLAADCVFAEYFNSLSPIYQDVLKCVMGYGENEPKSVAQTAQELGLSEARVHLIVDRSLRQVIRIYDRPKRSKRLADFMNGGTE